MNNERSARSVQLPDNRQMGNNPFADHIKPPEKAPTTLPIPAMAKKADMVDALSSGISSVDKLMAVTIVNSNVKKTKNKPKRTYTNPIFNTGIKNYALQKTG